MKRGFKGARRKNDFSYRPYDPAYHPSNLIELMSIGFFNPQIWDEWNISEATFYRWRKEHEELEEAYQIGLPKHEAYMINKHLIPMAEGKNEGKHSFNAIRYLMDAKYNYSKPAVVGNTTNISIGNIAISKDSTSAQLIDKIKENLQFLTNKNVLNAEYKVLEDQSNDESDEQDSQ